jgi:hypothetical protein
VQHRYQWCYFYAFVHPPSGRTVWLLLPTVSVAAFTIALAELAQVDVPRGLHLHVLPLYVPDPQSAERLWHLTNEALANRHSHDLDELQEVQVQRCLTLQTMPEFIRAHTNFHWWPQTA